MYSRLSRWIVAEEVASDRGLAARVAYQRILVAANVCSLLLAIAVGVVVLSADPAGLVDIHRRPFLPSDLHLPFVSATDSLVGAARNLPPLISPNGFLGFRSIALGSLPTTPDLSMLTLDGYDFRQSDAQQFSPEEPLSYSPMEGEGYRLEQPDNADFFVATRSFEPPAHGPTRPAQWVRQVEPKVPPSAQMMGAEGYVEVLLLIDELGRHRRFSAHLEDTIQTHPEFTMGVTRRDGSTTELEFYVAETGDSLLYVTLKEEPKGYRFADYVTEVLPQNVFAPAIRDGEPVATFVRLGFYFGEYGKCLHVEFTQSVPE